MPHINFREAIRVFLIWKTILIILAILLIGGSALLCRQLPHLVEGLLTECSPDFSKRSFDRLRLHNTLVAVTNEIGYPFDFLVYEESSPQVLPLPFRTNLIELIKYCSEDVVVVLRYSRPKLLDDHYKVYDVTIRRNEVTRLTSGWYED